MPKKRTSGVTRAEFLRLRKELTRVLAIVENNAESLVDVRKDCATNLRRCGELQREIDILGKTLIS